LSKHHKYSQVFIRYTAFRPQHSRPTWQLSAMYQNIISILLPVFSFFYYHNFIGRDANIFILK